MKNTIERINRRLDHSEETLCTQIQVIVKYSVRGLKKKEVRTNEGSLQGLLDTIKGANIHIK